MREYYVYILTNKWNTVLYTGVTNNLNRRISEHRDKVGSSFTTKYNLSKLAFYESTGDVEQAILREKQIKSWSRKKKIDLVQGMNPEWRDLAEELF